MHAMKTAGRLMARPNSRIRRLAGPFAWVLATVGCAASASAADVNSVLDIPLSTVSVSNGVGSYYKYGIMASFGGGTGPQLFEFDTGGSGIYAAYANNASWWGGNYTQTSYGSFNKDFSSNYDYQGNMVNTSVSLYGLSGGAALLTTSGATYGVGQANSISKNANVTWPQTSGSQTPPVEGAFYGDFGVQLTNLETGTSNLFAQLTYGAGVTAGYKVVVGPYGSTSGAYVQLGLATADLANPATLWFKMETGNTDNTPLPPFPNSGAASYLPKLINGNLTLTIPGLTQPPYSAQNIGLNLDTGTPQLTVYYNNSEYANISPYIDSNGYISSNVDVALSGITPSNTTVSLLTYTSGPTEGYNLVNVEQGGSYVNTGATLFQSYAVIYDLADGMVGLTPYPTTPEPPTWALMALGFVGLGFAAARARRNGARSPEGA